MVINTRQLQSVRAKFGLQQGDLAKVINKTEATYSRKENNKAPFHLIEAKKITDFINELDKERNWIIEDIFF